MSLQDREVLKKFLGIEDKKQLIGINKNITFGIEIESEGELYQFIMELGYLLPRNDQLIGDIDFWGAKIDTSLQKGVEVISPILTDCKGDIEDIYIICELLQNAKLETTERCGGHIHIGSDFLKTKEAYANLLEIFGNVERILYIMCNEKGSIPRHGISESAKAISSNVSESIKRGELSLEESTDLDEFIAQIKESQEERGYSINFMNINVNENTIEFRMPNGTLNPQTWIANIRLFGKIVEVSQRLSEIEKTKELSIEDIRLLYFKDRLIRDIPEKEKMETLLKLLFTDEEGREYRERYNVNSKLINGLSKEENVFCNTDFEPFSFSRRHKIYEFEEVATEEINKEPTSRLDIMKETIAGIMAEQRIGRDGR